MAGWFITGIGSGLGRALAQAALDRGDKVVGTTRKTADIAADLDHVVVTATRTAQTQDQTLAAITVIDRAQIQRLQPASLPDLLVAEAGDTATLAPSAPDPQAEAAPADGRMPAADRARSG